ncbi:unnamed protein product, partial [Nesidiocoris tenuis]
MRSMGGGEIFHNSLRAVGPRVGVISINERNICEPGFAGKTKSWNGMELGHEITSIKDSRVAAKP